MMMYQGNKEYIKHIGLPTYIQCYSKEQLELLNKIKLKEKEIITGYSDATGTVVRKARNKSKRVLYYAIVVNASLPASSSVTCLVLEIVSSVHDIIAITQWLASFKAFVLKEK